MKKLLTTCLLAYSSLALNLEASSPDFNVDLATGYRQDRFYWKSRDPHGVDDPSEAVYWKDLQLYEINGFMNLTTCNNWYFRVNGNYGRIYSGRALNKDYVVEREHLILSQKNKANAGRGEVFDAAGGAGYMFISSGGRLTIAPVIGYIHSEQHLRLFDVDNEFLLGDSPLGQIGGNNTYNTRWYGGFVAYDFILKMSCDVKFFGTIQGQMGNYRAKAHWTQNDTINGPFYHKANYVGFYGQGGFLYRFFCNNYIGVSGTYRNMWTHHGKQNVNRVVYTVDQFGYLLGQHNEDFEQHFHARWRAWSVLLNWFIDF